VNKNAVIDFDILVNHRMEVSKLTRDAATAYVAREFPGAYAQWLAARKAAGLA